MAADPSTTEEPVLRRLDVSTLASYGSAPQRSYVRSYEFGLEHETKFDKYHVVVDDAANCIKDVVAGALKALGGYGTGSPMALASGAMQALGAVANWVGFFQRSTVKTEESVSQRSFIGDTYVAIEVRYKCRKKETEVALVKSMKGQINLEIHIVAKVAETDNDATHKYLAELVSKHARDKVDPEFPLKFKF